MKSVLVKHQVKTLTRMIGKNSRIEVQIRYDDQCGNGHNSFSITGTIYSHLTSSHDRYHDQGGCIHNEIAKHFPELKPFIKWHLCSSDEPMYYVANTVYHAQDIKAYDFILRAENKQVRDLYLFDMPKHFLDELELHFKSLHNIYGAYDLSMDFQQFRKDNQSICEGKQYKYYSQYVDILKIEEFKKLTTYTVETSLNSRSKDADLKAAQSTAIWPDATLTQLLDEKSLNNRLPALMAAFKADVELLGFVY